MKDHVAAVDHLGEQRFVGHRVDDIRKRWIAFEVRDVVDGAGRQVVEDEHFMTARKQLLGEMRSNEPGTAGDERDHATTSRVSTARTADTTRSTARSERPGCSGSDSSSRAAREATGHCRVE